MLQFDISQEEFERLSESYIFAQRNSGKDSNWNNDIDEYARSIGALTEDEIELAIENPMAAIKNRIILRLFTEKRHKE